MFLGKQDFDFAQIKLNLPKSNHFFRNLSSNLPKFRLNFAQKILLRDAAASSALAALDFKQSFFLNADASIVQTWDLRTVIYTINSKHIEYIWCYCTAKTCNNLTTFFQY